MFAQSPLTSLLFATITTNLNVNQCAAQDIDWEDGVLAIIGTDMDDLSTLWANWDFDAYRCTMRYR
ncbi:MAG: hypothetical protein VXZ82_04770 [Planctomycetota bacterium]|nr:hypothetical protein [Planctomycetota bacterium]